MKLRKKQDGNPDRARRRFLGQLGRATAATGVAASATGAALRGADAAPRKVEFKAGVSPVPGYNWYEHRWAYGIDANKCIGCLRCAEACKIENGVVLTAHHFRTWVERYAYLEGEMEAQVDSQVDPANIAAAGEDGHYRFDNRYRNKPVSKSFFVPKMCNHCQQPSCVQVCPVGATFRTPDGVVLVDKEYCIGCRYCVQACPYGARYLNPETRTADKCTWCYHRITKGLKPACVEACPVGARVFGDLNDPKSDINEFLAENRVQVLKPWTGNKPNCYYVGIDKEVS